MQMMHVIARFIVSVSPIDHLQIPDDFIIKLSLFIGIFSLMVGKMVPYHTRVISLVMGKMVPYHTRVISLMMGKMHIRVMKWTKHLYGIWKMLYSLNFA